MTVYFFGFVSRFFPFLFFFHTPSLHFPPSRSIVGVLLPTPSKPSDYSSIRISLFDSVILTNSIGFVT